MKHWEYHPEPQDGCFGCKALGLQMNAGEAKERPTGMTDRQWDSELEAYRNARSHGIQPAGTTMKAIREAERASEVMGKPYDANTMPNTNTIVKQSVSSLSSVGVI